MPNNIEQANSPETPQVLNQKFHALYRAIPRVNIFEQINTSGMQPYFGIESVITEDREGIEEQTLMVSSMISKRDNSEILLLYKTKMEHLLGLATITSSFRAKIVDEFTKIFRQGIKNDPPTNFHIGISGKLEYTYPEDTGIFDLITAVAVEEPFYYDARSTYVKSKEFISRIMSHSDIGDNPSRRKDVEFELWKQEFIELYKREPQF